MVESRFRKDLYYRLNVARMHLPPLRERVEDILPLFAHYLSESERRPRAGGRDPQPRRRSPGSSAYDWPGNVRELRNVDRGRLRRSVRTGPISLRGLPRGLRRDSAGVREVLPGAERDRLLARPDRDQLEQEQGRGRLHWSRMTLYRKMAKYHLVETGRTGTASGRTAPAARDLSHLA